MNGKSLSRRKGLAVVPALIVILFMGGAFLAALLNVPTVSSMNKFTSCHELSQEFQEAFTQSTKGMYWGMRVETMEAFTVPASAVTDGGVQYSTTNVQVAGVDEADIVKTDGEYIYTISGGKLVISKAFPAEEAGVRSTTDLGRMNPREMFIQGNMVLVFGSDYAEFDAPGPAGAAGRSIAPYPYYSVSLTVVQLWDVSDRASPELARSLDFEGDYTSSRKIGGFAYFVINSYPYHILEQATGVQGSIVPLHRDRTGQEVESETAVDFEPACACDQVGYFEPVNPERFVTVASISLTDPGAEVVKEVIVGSGQNVYASQDSLYLAENSFPFWVMAEGSQPQEKTIVHKFSLQEGQISYTGNMQAPGRVLNQFSMDEYQGHFRIATTLGRVTRAGGTTSNNVYIFNENLQMAGSLEDLAPGESIYSARFMGDRGYLVTFQKIDPLFVIDLSDPANPQVLGKLKIPGYSDYLHPYDENHLIGIGKEAVEAEEPWGDFAWYQGVKMALFDVSDVENPKELHKVVIGDRGTDSDALHDHKAFLFDREKGLLIVPILLAEIDESRYADREVPANAYGEFVYQGAYVYGLTLENGFDLRGRITHYETSDEFMKSGYYFRGSHSVRRSLYIEDVLYTLSDSRLKLNRLGDLSEITELVLSQAGTGPVRPEEVF